MFGRIFAVLVVIFYFFGTTVFAQPQSTEQFTVILFENVRIFDGKSDTLSVGMNVLVRGNTIDKISKRTNSNRSSVRILRSSPAAGAR